MFNWDLASTRNWREDLARLTALKAEIDEASAEVPVMRGYLQKRYAQKVAQFAPAIKAGVIAEHRQAQAAFVRADEKSRAAYNRELGRWDADKYASARANVRDRVEQIRKSSSNFALTGGPDKVEKLKSLQVELMASNDIHIKRACAEFFEGEIQDLPWSGDAKNGKPIVYQLGELVVSAREALPALRTTPEQEAALSELGAAYNDLIAAQVQLADIGKQLGDDPTTIFAGASDIARAYQAVQFREDGTVKIDNPEVTR